MPRTVWAMSIAVMSIMTLTPDLPSPTTDPWVCLVVPTQDPYCVHVG